MTPLVSQWLANPALNFGMLMKSEEELRQASFASSEAGDRSQRPRLVLNTLMPCGGPAIVLSTLDLTTGQPVIVATVNTPVRLRIDLLNGATTAATLNGSPTIMLPPGISVANPTGATTSGCGGLGFYPGSGGTTLTLSGGSIPAASGTSPGVCTLTVSVIGSAPSGSATLASGPTGTASTFTFPAGALSTSRGSNANAASTPLYVVPLPTLIADTSISDNDKDVNYGTQTWLDCATTRTCVRCCASPACLRPAPGADRHPAHVPAHRRQPGAADDDHAPSLHPEARLDGDGDHLEEPLGCGRRRHVDGPGADATQLEFADDVHLDRLRRRAGGQRLGRRNRQLWPCVPQPGERAVRHRRRVLRQPRGVEREFRTAPGHLLRRTLRSAPGMAKTALNTGRSRCSGRSVSPGTRRNPLRIIPALRTIWSASRFVGDEVSAYAAEVMETEARRGVRLLGLILLALLLGEAALHAGLGLGHTHVYTFLALAALAGHIAVSTRAARGLRTLYMLGMVLIVVSGAALVLLAHRTGSFGSLLMSAIALLFIIVPIVPWGLREALTVTALIYGVFTASTATTPMRFAAQDLWALQFLMLGAGTVSLALVVRAVLMRKKEIEARFDLERSHRHVQMLSLQDPLTGTWNRRYLVAHFEERVLALRGNDLASTACWCCWTSTASSRSTTPTATPTATACCNAWPRRTTACCTTARCWCAWAATIRDRAARERRPVAPLAGVGRVAGVRARARRRRGDPADHQRRLRAPAARTQLSLDDSYARADLHRLYAAKRAGGNRIVDGDMPTAHFTPSGFHQTELDAVDSGSMGAGR